MALAAACDSPLQKRWKYAIFGIAAAAVACKIALPDHPWGLSFARQTVQPASAPLRNYCESKRGNELISQSMWPTTSSTPQSSVSSAHLRYAVVTLTMTGGTFSLLDFCRHGNQLA